MSLQENWFSLSNTKNSHRHVTVCNKHYNRLCHTKRGSPSNMRASGHMTLLLLLSCTKLLRLFWMWTIHSTPLNSLDMGVKTFLHIKLWSRDQYLLRIVVRKVSFYRIFYIRSPILLQWGILGGGKIFSMSCSIFEKFIESLVGAAPLEGWRPLLRGILDPSLYCYNFLESKKSKRFSQLLKTPFDLGKHSFKQIPMR